jgi:hypothetical protein
LASIAENLTAVHQELYTITIAVQLDLWQTKDEVAALSYPNLSDLLKKRCYLEGFRISTYVLVCATYTWRWVNSAGGMRLKDSVHTSL